MKYSIHCAVSKCISSDLGLFRSALYAFYIQIRWLKPTAMDTNLPLLQISSLAHLGSLPADATVILWEGAAQRNLSFSSGPAMFRCSAP